MDILLIEDDARVADFIMRGLQAEGYAVQWVRTGRAGLAAAEGFSRSCAAQTSTGVVILDVLLPELDGLPLCQMLRQRGHHVPVLMLSAMGESHERVDGLRRGADDYLTKPFDFDELLARIEALMRRADAGPGKRRVTLKVATRPAPAHPGASVMLEGAVVGTVTSGAWGYRVGMNLAYAYLAPEHAGQGTRLQIDICGEMVGATVIAPSPYDPGHMILRA